MRGCLFCRIRVSFTTGGFAERYHQRSRGRWRMSSKPVAREQRRSTRVPLKVTIKAHGVTEPLTCEGETIIVTLHGALLSTAVPLKVGMLIEVEVFLTGKRAQAMVCNVDPEQPLRCGIALVKAENIWGVSLPPVDWIEGHDPAHMR